jgi:hypothetical protein
MPQRGERLRHFHHLDGVGAAGGEMRGGDEGEFHTDFWQREYRKFYQGFRFAGLSNHGNTENTEF